MKSKTLAVLMTALSIGVSPVGMMSASAQDVPILPKKGAAQSGQSSDGAAQQPDAGGAASGGAGASTGQGTQQPSGSDGSSSGASSGTTDGSGQTASEPDSKTQPGAKTQSGSSDSSTAQKSGQSATEGQKPAGSKEGMSTDTSTGSGETQKSGDAATSSGGSTETQSNSKTNVDNNTDANTKNTTKTETNNTTNVNISVEQQTEIRTVVKEVHVEPVRDVDFTVSVGTTIPKKIRLEPLPPRIVEIVPQYKAYRFFILADGRIVIVDPSAFTIVYIITA
ncbi:hypothetical protein B5K08_09055 [Rhizobium leguminosarum bv. trifolii]|uniref:DUF1236 domain-containing protein n=1 Tax=Rhizobium leguminosarum bv. trifolii TaxID=386 RepID=A0A3E1BR99_RHILT|nr:DUF1236 domain-containing protein [Rhizobium leguminosarum]RFB96508.1 hypothetical protein B5K08_09055 [Rhizobium leguminosarum bv. trifolii]RFB96631.1 hypothetical protein B5K10_09040 [Rhizobium leguminosarum bv. trifolii]